MSPPLECVFEKCSRTFDKKWKLDEHICSHTGERPFICAEPGCDKSFVRKAHLQRHAVSHSDERPFSCATCNSSFKVLSNLRKHEKIHAGKKPYECHVAECSSAFLKKTQLYAHLLAAHEISTPFKCEVCGSNFTTQSHLNRHTQNQHLSRFMCTDCYQMFDKFSALQKHIGKAHKKKPRCALCGLTFSCQTNLNSHVATVHVGNDGCSSSQSSVEVRTEVVSSDQVTDTADNGADTGSIDSSGVGYFNVQYSEDVGDIFEEDKTEIEVEESKPGIDKNAVKCFKCGTCHQTFSSKTVLTKHMKTVHNTIKITEFKCSECSGIFKSKSNIVKHIQSKHKGMKRFYCSLCPMKFYYKQAYDRHTATVHSGKAKVQRKPWNKTSLAEDLTGHFVSERVGQYVDKMRELGYQQKAVNDDGISEHKSSIAGS